MDTNPVVAPTSLEEVKRKTHLTGKVMKIGLAGAVIDVGLIYLGARLFQRETILTRWK